MQERGDVVNGNKTEIEGLFDKRSSAEQAFLERYMAAAEDYNLLKVRCKLVACTHLSLLESVQKQACHADARGG